MNLYLTKISRSYVKGVMRYQGGPPDPLSLGIQCSSKTLGIQRVKRNVLLSFYPVLVKCSCEKVIFVFERTYITSAFRKSILDMPVSDGFRNIGH